MGQAVGGGSPRGRGAAPYLCPGPCPPPPQLAKHRWRPLDTPRPTILLHHQHLLGWGGVGWGGVGWGGVGWGGVGWGGVGWRGVGGAGPLLLISFLPAVANTMFQCPISTFFSTPVQPCPSTKCDDVIDANVYFRFQDRWTGKKRQEAYNVAQKAGSTLFLNTPMAPLCEFIRQAAIMARQDCSSEEDDIGESNSGESNSD